MSQDVRYTFGPFQLDTAERTLTREGRPIRLTPKDLGVLLALVERHGALVDRDRLFAQVWPGVIVEDCNLARHVATLRQALGDVAESPTYIETLPKRGYRFVAPVQVVAAPPAVPVPAPAPDAQDATAPGTTAPAIIGTAPAEAAAPAPEVVAAPPARRRLTWVPPGLGLVRALLAFGGLLGLTLLGWHSSGAATRASGPIRSVAVLPVGNLSGDPGQDHLAEALGAMLVTDLGRRPEVSVVSRGSARRFDRSALPAHDIGRELGVDGLLEAAIVRADHKVRVAAELVDARTDRLVWAEVFEGDACDFMELEDLIADAAAEALGIQPPAGAPGEVARPTHPAVRGLTCSGAAESPVAQ